MKNKIKYFAMATGCLSVALLSGCQKEQQAVTLTATVEDVMPEPGAKVHLDNNRVPGFDLGDQVKVNGAVYKIDVAGPRSFLSLVSGTAATSPYYYVYPADGVTSTVTSQPSVKLPATQSYTEVSGIQELKAPMGGASNNGSLMFHNFCSLLKVNVSNPSDASGAVKIKDIEVSSQTIKLSYASGLQLNKAMDASNPDVIPSLVAQTHGTTVGADSAVTLTGCNTTIAAGSSKSFLVYLPTYKPTDGRTLSLHIKVIVNEGSKLVSYTRSIRVDSLERNVMYTRDFALSNVLRKVEKYYFNVGTTSSPTYVEFTKHNEGATNQEGLGTPNSAAASTATNLLTPTQWNTLFSTSGKSGLVKHNGSYYWALLIPDFVYPAGCAQVASAAWNNANSTATVTIMGNNTSASVPEYDNSKWAQMEEAGAIFIPIDGAIPENPSAKEETTLYTFYNVPGCASQCNMYFKLYYKVEKNNNVWKVTASSVVAGTNLQYGNNNTPTSYYERRITNM